VSDETTLSSAKTTRKRGLLLLGAAVVIAGLGWGGYTLFFAPASEETDDAYVAGDIVQVTAREQGTVIALHADNTQSVKAGEPLVDFDPALVNAQMAAAEADLAKAVRGAAALRRWMRPMPRSPALRPRWPLPKATLPAVRKR
jgi:membrane fusion protein (multidrug efflux system)